MIRMLSGCVWIYVVLKSSMSTSLSFRKLLPRQFQFLPSLSLCWRFQLPAHELGLH